MENYRQLEVCAVCESANCREVMHYSPSYNDESHTVCEDCSAIEQGYKTLYECQFCGIISNKKENCHCHGN